MHTGFCWRNLREWDHLQDIGFDGSVILKWIFTSLSSGVEWKYLTQYENKVEGSSKHSDKPSGSVKRGDMLTS
jgi:hypothetical protein